MLLFTTRKLIYPVGTSSVLLTFNFSNLFGIRAFNLIDFSNGFIITWKLQQIILYSSETCSGLKNDQPTTVSILNVLPNKQDSKK